jgi:Leucine-rich repeat (LRR) protein
MLKENLWSCVVEYLVRSDLRKLKFIKYKVIIKHITKLNITGKNKFLLRFNFVNLTYLYCCDCNLTELPMMNNLRWLSCNNNNLTELPQMDNLRYLSCHNNNLTWLPQMNNLIWLSCTNNNLTWLPLFNNLSWLCCSGNTLPYSYLEGYRHFVISKNVS